MIVVYECPQHIEKSHYQVHKGSSVMGVLFLGGITRIPMLAAVMLLNLFNVICKSSVSDWCLIGLLTVALTCV